MNSIHIGPDEGEKIPRGPRYHRVLAELPELEVIDARFGPGFSVEPHTHRDHVDSFYVLDGEAEFTLGDEVVRAGAGTWVRPNRNRPRLPKHRRRRASDSQHPCPEHRLRGSASGELPAVRN